MTTTDVERAAHAATEALAKFDRAGIYEVMQTVPALAQALRELLATVTTPSPPADDVREAVERITDRVFHSGYFNRPVAVVETADLRLVLDAFKAEVRPHGTVTDAEVEAGAWALLDRGMDLADRNPTQQVYDEAKADARAVLEAAREVHP